MAEALLSALEGRERPASSYYNMAQRAEGQPTLTIQEEGRDTVAFQAAPEQRPPPHRAIPKLFNRVMPSRPSSPEDDLFRHLEALAAEDAAGVYVPNNEHIQVINNRPNQPQAAQVNQQQEAEREPNPFQQPPLPPPPIAVQPPQDASVMFYGLEHRADSFHNGRTGLEVGVSNVNGQITMDIDRDVGTLRRYAVGIKDASIEFNLAYSSNTNGNLIQRRPAATQTNKPEAGLVQYESPGQSKRRNRARWGLMAANFFHVFTCGLAVIIFMLWCFPIVGSVQPASNPFAAPDLPDFQAMPDFEQEEPVIFIHSGVMYPSSQIVGARIDIDTISVVHLGQAAVSLGHYLVEQKEFKSISNHLSVAGHAATVLKTKLNMVQTKTNEAATSLKVSRMWQPKDHHLQTPTISASLKAKLSMSQASLKVVPPQPQQQEQHKAKRSIWDAVTGVFNSFVDGILSVFHLTSNRHMEASLQNLQYHEKKMNAKFIEF